jgi:ATP-dependent Clp protease protease subunit
LNKKFWNCVETEEGRTLYLDGAIAEETWYGDEVTPKQFKSELMSGKGDITIWLNSPGGCVFAASQIYNMLMEYKGRVTIKIDGIAASAASVIAMAGTDVFMSPVSMMMIHNPMTIAFGDKVEMEKAIEMLNEVKESIINAYEIKTNQTRTVLSHLMDSETWMNAKKAIELGFADAILEDTKKMIAAESFQFSTREFENHLLNKIVDKVIPTPKKEGRKVTELKNELNKIKKYI